MPKATRKCFVCARVIPYGVNHYEAPNDGAVAHHGCVRKSVQRRAAKDRASLTRRANPVPRRGKTPRSRTTLVHVDRSCTTRTTRRAPVTTKKRRVPPAAPAPSSRFRATSPGAGSVSAASYDAAKKAARAGARKTGRTWLVYEGAKLRAKVVP